MSPVDGKFVALRSDDGLPKGPFFVPRPVLVQLLNLHSSLLQGGHIFVAGPAEVLDGVVEEIEIMGISG